ncbi:hypothetical protein IPF37_00530 [bacterium]|nr:MAG: hypothetical protein IPF37_00530 [bacterium]
MKTKKTIVLLLGFIIAMSHPLVADNAQAASYAGMYPRTAHAIIVEDLDLYKILQKIETLVDVNAEEVSEVDNQIHQNVVFFLEEAKKLFSIIVTGFNEGHLSKNPEIKYKFVNLCNYFNGIERIKPRHLRAFEGQIKKFDRAITAYCLKRKHGLSIDDLNLFDHITRFNQQLLMCLQAEELFEIDLMDSVVDYTVYQPWEFVCEHKLLVGASLVLVAGLITYFYILPIWEEQKRLENLNKFFEVKQFKVIPQSGMTCSLHALHNYLILAQDVTEEEMGDNLQDEDRWGKNRIPWMQWIKDQGIKSEALDAQSVEELIDHFNLNQNGLIVIPGYEALRNTCDLEFLSQWHELFTQLHGQGASNVLAFLRSAENLDHYQNSEQWQQLVDLAGHNRVAFLMQPNSREHLATLQQATALENLAQTDGLCEKYQAFRDHGQPVHILLNTASNDRAFASKDGGKKMIGHWIAASFVPAKEGIRIRVADSLNTNFTADPAITRMAELLTNKK